MSHSIASFFDIFRASSDRASRKIEGAAKTLLERSPVEVFRDFMKQMSEYQEDNYVLFTNAVVAYYLTKYTLAGEQIFSIGPYMQSLLSYTDVSVDLLRFRKSLPYPSFYIDLPSRILCEGNEEECYGVFVFRNEESEKEISSLTGLPSLGSSPFDQDLVFGFAIRPILSKKAGSLLVFGIELDPQDSECLCSDSHVEYLHKHGLSPEVFQIFSVESFKCLLRIVSNLIAYLDSYQPETETFDPRLNSLPDSRITRVYPSIEKVDITNGQGTSPRAHWVRGHWRKQPFGPRSDPQYRRVWIKPFVRGDTDNFVPRDHYKITPPQR
jgi:hypothetical protein